MRVGDAVRNNKVAAMAVPGPRHTDFVILNDVTTAATALLDRERPIALWRQLKLILRDRILGEMGPGARLPTEADLCASYGVSRITVRQALNSLVSEGMLVRTPGRGTYVAEPQATEGISLDAPLAGLFAVGHPEQRVQVTSREVLYPDRRLQQVFAVPPDALLHKVRRLVLEHDEPVAYEVHYAPDNLAPGFSAGDIDELDVAGLLARRHGLERSRIDYGVQAAAADHWRAVWLKLSVGTPMLLVEAIALLADATPFHYARSFLRSDRFRLRLTLEDERT